MNLGQKNFFGTQAKITLWDLVSTAQWSIFRLSPRKILAWVPKFFYPKIDFNAFQAGLENFFLLKFCYFVDKKSTQQICDFLPVLPANLFAADISSTSPRRELLEKLH